MSHLPLVATPFIGRESDLDSIINTLSNPACRLLTLVGMGGMGKTRLALEAARALETRFAGGAYFVPLQAVSAAHYIIPAIAEALQIELYQAGDLRGQLVNALGERPVLLVLDNFEHLLDGAPLLSDLLGAAPHIALLITSREPLHLQEECLHPVQGMRFPTPSNGHSNGAAFEDYGAVQLFVQAARRMRADFAPDAERDGIARICALVEGMPLALELAASWVRSLSCDDIAREIEHGLDILETPIRNIPARHRNMRAVLEYSWGLLDEDEQRVYRRLSVLRGGFTREAAEAVAGASLRHLTTLVDKSLLRYDTRYELHELLRQFAEEKLNADSAELAATRDRHRAFYADFLCDRWALMQGAGLKTALDEIEDELENVRAAWAWAVETRDETTLDCVTPPLWFFYDVRARYAEGSAAFERAVEALRPAEERPECSARVILYAKLLARYGAFFYSLNQAERCRDLLDESIEILRRCKARHELGFPLVRRAEVLYRLGPNDEATSYFAEAARIFRDMGERLYEAFALYSLSWALEHLDPDRAEQLALESLAISRQLESRWGLFHSYFRLIEIVQRRGDLDQAEQYARDAYAISREIGLGWGMPVILVRQAALASQRNDRETLLRCALSAAQQALEYGLTPFAVDAVFLVATHTLQQGRQAEAIEWIAATFAHPTDYYVSHERVTVLRQLEAQMPPDDYRTAFERGKTRMLGELLKRMKAELESLSAPRAASPQPLIDPLTARELDILRWMAAGYSNREIAEQMVFAVGTVKWYVNQIYTKLGVSGRARAVVYAREIGLIE